MYEDMNKNMTSLAKKASNMGTEPKINEIPSELTDQQFDFSDSEDCALDKTQKDNALEKDDSNTDL